MHGLSFDLNLLPVLDAIYNEGSITAAAKQLNLTQPAVSHALRRLREYFEDPLFIRQGNKMVPTSLTKQVLPTMQQALRQINVGIQHAHEFDPVSAERTFYIAMSGVFESYFLPLLMKRLQEAAPGISIVTVKTSRRDIEPELTAGNIDFAVDVLFPVGESISQQTMLGENLMVIARKGHPTLKGGLDEKAYLSLSHILVSSRRTGMGVEDFELSRFGLQRNITLRCQSYLSACAVVATTDLISTIPGHFSSLVNALYDNEVYSFPFTVPKFESYLYWHKPADNDPANIWVREQIFDLLGLVLSKV